MVCISKALQGIFLVLPLAQGRANPRAQSDIPIPTAVAAATTPLTAHDATTTPFNPPLRFHGELVKRTEVASIDGYTHLGCWADGSNHILSVTAYFDNGMTPDLCKNRCSLASCPMFGVENGYHCYCGSSIEAFAVSATDDGCTATCWGDKNKICGGVFRMNVYSTDDPNAVPAPASGSSTSRARTTSRASQTTSASGSGSTADSGADSGGGTGDADSDNNSDNNNGGGNSSSSSSSSSSSVSLPIGAIVGIAIGAAAIAGIIAALVVLLLRRRRKDNTPTPQPATSQVQYSNAPHPPASVAGFAAPGYAKLDPMLDGTPIQTAVHPVNQGAPSPPPQTVSPVSNGVPQPVQHPGPYHEMPSPYHGAQEMPGR